MSAPDVFGSNMQTSHPFSFAPPLKDNVHLDASLAASGKTADASGAVKLIKGHDTVATFPAKVAEQKVPVTANGYGQDADSKALTAIYFGGKHYSLQVPPTAAQQSNPQGNSGASK